jgi:hypothetical protein
MASTTTFFTAAEPDDHSEAWRAQALLIRRLTLQPYNDFLFEVVRDSLIARRSEIRASLHAAVATSASKSGFQVPLWTYQAVRFPTQDEPPNPDIRQDALEFLCDQGYQWLVGRASSDFGGAGADYVWDATRPIRPVPVHDVVRCTDFVHRLALFFGDTHYRVSFQRIAWGTLEVPTDVEVSTYQLVLHYHPTGIYGRVAECIRDAKVAYSTYTPWPLADWDRPLVWSGRMRTPPSSPTPPCPPGAPVKRWHSLDPLGAPLSGCGY